MNDTELLRRAYAGEIIGDGQRQNELLVAENRELREHYEKFVGFAATCRRENTYNWMVMMLNWLNDAASKLDPEKYFRLGGADHFQMLICPRKLTPPTDPVQ